MNPPAFDLGTIVSVYGPLGLMTVGSLLAAAKIWRIREADRTAADLAHRAEIEVLRAKHAAELKIWEDRYLAKADSSEEQYYNLAKSLGETLDQALRRLK